MWQHMAAAGEAFTGAGAAAVMVVVVTVVVTVAVVTVTAGTAMVGTAAGMAACISAVGRTGTITMSGTIPGTTPTPATATRIMIICRKMPRPTMQRRRRVGTTIATTRQASILTCKTVQADGSAFLQYPRTYRRR